MVSAASGTAATFLMVLVSTDCAAVLLVGWRGFLPADVE